MRIAVSPPALHRSLACLIAIFGTIMANTISLLLAGYWLYWCSWVFKGNYVDCLGDYSQASKDYSRIAGFLLLTLSIAWASAVVLCNIPL